MKIKRLLALLLTVVLILGVCACGREGKESDSAEARRAEYQPGSYVTLGSYPQTEAGTDQTPIEWLVLESDGETALLISRYALDCQPFNTENESITWEDCTLRKWLNNEFYNRAFSAEEKKRILVSDVSADRNPAENPWIDMNPGNATKDSVFLLSILEANRYFSSNEERMCAVTDYAIEQGAYIDSNYAVGDRPACWWWLRSRGFYVNDAARVYIGGYILERGHGASNVGDGVRPCVRVRLS